MTIYLITPFEDFTAICTNVTDAYRLMVNHIGMISVSRGYYDRVNRSIAEHPERQIKTKAAYRRWRKSNLRQE